MASLDGSSKDPLAIDASPGDDSTNNNSSDEDSDSSETVESMSSVTEVNHIGAPIVIDDSDTDSAASSCDEETPPGQNVITEFVECKTTPYVIDRLDDCPREEDIPNPEKNIKCEIQPVNTNRQSDDASYLPGIQVKELQIRTDESIDISTVVIKEESLNCVTIDEDQIKNDILSAVKVLRVTLPVMSLHLRNFICKFCYKIFTTASSFRIHRSNVHGKDTRLHCRLCPFTCYSADTMANHKTTVNHNDEEIKSDLTLFDTINNTYKCSICSYVCDSLRKANEHNTIHSDKYKFKCQICSYVCKESSELSLHNSSVHSDVYMYKCEYCSYTAKTLHHFVIHKRKHKNELRLKCKSCSFVCKDLNEFNAHRLVHNGRNGQYNCYLCPYRCKHLSGLTRHIKNHKSRKDHMCPVCPYECVTLESLESHILTHNFITRYRCIICRFECETSEEIIQHKSFHNVKILTCRKCPYKTMNLGVMECHSLIHTGFKPFKYENTEIDGIGSVNNEDILRCDLCPFVTSGLSQLTLHRLAHCYVRLFKHDDGLMTDDNETNCYDISFDNDNEQLIYTKVVMLLCKICPYECNHLTDMIEHESLHGINSKDTDELFKCHLCPYFNKSFYMVKKHSEIHMDSNRDESNINYIFSLIEKGRMSDESGDVLFKCDLCRFSCKFLYDLKQHKLTHPGVLEVSDESSSDCEKLDDSNRRKSGERWFHCNLCRYKTSRYPLLKIHRILHRDVKLFKCDNCSYKTVIKSRFKLHKIIHVTGKMVKCRFFKSNDISRKYFVCKLCDFKTWHSKLLKSHKKKHLNPTVANVMTLHSCDMCSMQYKMLINLEKHRLTHESNLKKQNESIDTNELVIVSSESIESEKSVEKSNESVCNDITDKNFDFTSSVVQNDNDSIGIISRDNSVRPEGTVNENSRNSDTQYSCDLCHFHCETLVHLDKHRLLSHKETEVVNDKINFKSNFSGHINEGEKQDDVTIQKMNQSIGDIKQSVLTKTCTVCLHKFTNLRTLIAHYKSEHPGKGYLKCDMCPYECMFGSRLARHKSTHITEKLFKCLVCDFRCKTKYLLEKHERIHSDDKPYKCDVCPYAAVSVALLNVHRAIHFPDKRHKCPLCDYSTVQKYKLTVHNLTHTKIKSHKCDLCPYSSTMAGNLKLHKSNRHYIERTANKISCDLCPYKTNLPVLLKRHKRRHHSESCDKNKKVFQCDMCPYKSIVKTNLINHITFVHNPNNKFYKCEACNYSCKRLKSLEIHKKCHTNERAFKCDLCPYASTTKLGLNKHRLIHDPVKPYKCDLCDYCTVHKPKLKTHRMVHFNDKPLKCDLCPFRCKQPTNLKDHKKRHTGEKPFMCDVCGYTSSGRGQLNKHILANHTEKSV